MNAENEWVAHVNEVANYTLFPTGQLLVSWEQISPANHVSSCRTLEGFRSIGKNALRSRPAVTWGLRLGFTDPDCSESGCPYLYPGSGNPE